MLIPVFEACQQLLANTTDYGSETVPLTSAFGRCLRQSIIADRDQPPFDRVAMDGITINYTLYASGQRLFPIAGLQAAGAPPLPLSNPATCLEIMTGAALPPGATTVIRYEDLQREGEAFRLPEGIENGANLHLRGKDVTASAVLAESGRYLGVAEVGMLATCGYDQVKVARLPKVAIVATGNELVPVDTIPEPHQIRRSNFYQLAALLHPLKIAASLHHLSDDRAQLEEGLEKLLADFDVVILSGGVSKGKLDFVPEVLTDLGVEKLFHGVAQRPGKPLWCGRRDQTMVFGLPGNPVSSISCGVHYVLPFLRNCLGLPALKPVYGRLTQELTFKPALTLFERVSVSSQAETGELQVTPVKHAGSGDAGSLLRTDAFAEFAADRTVFSEGHLVRIRFVNAPLVAG